MRRSTIITLVIFALLLVGVILVNRRPAARGAASLELGDLTADTVERIDLAGPDNKGLTIVRLENVWRVDDEKKHLADPKAVERALEAVAAVDTDEVVSTSPARREYYGVDDESGLHIGLKTVDSEEKLVFGSSKKGGSYLRREGEDRIFKVLRNLGAVFPLEKARWFKLTLVDRPFEDLTGVEFAIAGQPPFTVRPASEDEWTLEDASVLPEGFRFDGREAMSTARSAAGLRASKIVDDEVEDTGLGEGEDRITLIYEDGTTVIHIGKKTDDGEFYARVDGRDDLLLLPGYRVDGLRKKPEEMRDLRVMSFDPAAVTAVELKGGTTDIRLVRDAGGWKADETVAAMPEDLDFDPSTVDRFLESLKDLRATEWLGNDVPRGAGLDHPSVVVTLEFGDREPARLVFGKKIADREGPPQFYGRGNADDAVYAISSFQRDRIRRGWDLFRRPPAGPPGGMGSIDPETLKNLPPEIREQLLQQIRQQQQQQELLKRIQAKQ